MLSDVRSVNIKRKVCLRINEISNPHKILTILYLISHLLKILILSFFLPHLSFEPFATAFSPPQGEN